MKWIYATEIRRWYMLNCKWDVFDEIEWRMIFGEEHKFPHKIGTLKWQPNLTDFIGYFKRTAKLFDKVIFYKDDR